MKKKPTRISVLFDDGSVEEWEGDFQHRVQPEYQQITWSLNKAKVLEADKS